MKSFKKDNIKKLNFYRFSLFASNTMDIKNVKNTNKEKKLKYFYMVYFFFSLSRQDLVAADAVFVGVLYKRKPFKADLTDIYVIALMF